MISTELSTHVLFAKVGGPQHSLVLTGYPVGTHECWHAEEFQRNLEWSIRNIYLLGDKPTE